MLDLRKCELSDLAALTGIEQNNMQNPWTEKMLQEALLEDNYLFLAAVENVQMAGYVSACFCLDECELCNIAVEKKFRRRGAATLLLRSLEDECRQRGIVSIFLEVNETNDSAIALYEKNGFERMGIRPRYYGDHSAITMRKRI